MVDEAPPVKILAVMGLGNPGRRYSANRHNFGYMVVDRLAFLKKEEFIKGSGPFVHCQVQSASGGLFLCKSTTYMNNSGRTALSLVDHFGIETQNLLVVSDDCSIPLGKIRFRKSGSDGGHNGLASIVEYLKTGNFRRLRLGIGPNDPDMPLEDYVLEDFAQNELKNVGKVVLAASDFIMNLAKKKLDNTSVTFTVTEE